VILTLALALASASAFAEADAKEVRRLAAAAEVVQEIVDTPEGIPQDLLDKAYCIAIIPSAKKAALGIGARFGKGAAVCRTDRGAGPWGAPLMMSIGGGSFGLQIGGQAVDYIFVIMNPRGMETLLKSKFTLGADCSIAAGPKGRTMEAATDAQMRAEILAYSRGRGVFAGVSLEGAVLKQDKDANLDLYGSDYGPKDVLLSTRKNVPEAAKPLVDALRVASPERVAPAH
jgi:SH3 domain-containing YSC84-like protein 1